jgi:hypothetical protein
MSHSRTLLLPLLLTACGQGGASNQLQAIVPSESEVDVRTEFFRLAANDTWANWPDRLQEDPADDGKPCHRVPEQSRERAIARLAEAPAAALNAREYREFTGAESPQETDGALYLLRGFSTTNSAARVKVIGKAVTVHSDALGGLFNLRRHPCIAALSNAPTEIYTVVAYDL